MDELRIARPADLDALATPYGVARYRWAAEEEARASGIPFALARNIFTGMPEWWETDAHLKERILASLQQ